MRRATRSFLTACLLTACAPSTPGSDAAASDAAATDSFVRDATAVDGGGADSGVACDPNGGGGCEPGESCTFVSDGADGFVLACVAITGSVGLGETCVRDPALGHGHDDCAAGTFCTFIGVRRPEDGGARRCRDICRTDAECETGERCAFTGQGWGFCGPTCEPFGPCDDGLSCALPTAPIEGDTFLVCRVATDAMPGVACSEPEDCGPSQVCFLDGTCHALCDPTHPCASGECPPVVGDVGVCR